MIKAIMFDLDGTLLPMDQAEFTKAYFKQLTKKLAVHGYSPEKLTAALWSGVEAMVKNDGACLNEEVFWKVFSKLTEKSALDDLPIFDEFYRTDFNKVADVCGYNELSADTVKQLKDSGYRLILATNPIFPAVATENRICWAGLKPEDFELYTTYENSHYCKPNPAYYKEILEKCGLEPQECLMVGNDAEEDLAAENLGIKVFLLTDCLINTRGIDVESYPHGGFAELKEYIKTI